MELRISQLRKKAIISFKRVQFLWRLNGSNCSSHRAACLREINLGLDILSLSSVKFVPAQEKGNYKFWEFYISLAPQRIQFALYTEQCVNAKSILDLDT